MSAAVELDETAVRVLRDLVYGVPSTDKNWEGCKENWMKPESVEWLRQHSKVKLLDRAGKGGQP